MSAQWLACRRSLLVSNSSIALGIPVKGNKRNAQARLEELKREYSAPEWQWFKSKANSLLFADFLWDWLKTTAPTIERTTYHGYESIISARLDPFFRERGLRLCDVEPRHIRERHQSIFQDGCNANTVIHYHAVVRKALQYAVKNELISENAADKVARPKKGKFLAGFYTKDELTALFEATKDDSMSVVIQLAAYYGLQPIRFHDLRHSCASLLLSQGVPMKQIPDWLGHSTFATTADIYSHLDFNSKQDSANAIASAFEPKQAEEVQKPEPEPGFGMSMEM